MANEHQSSVGCKARPSVCIYPVDMCLPRYTRREGAVTDTNISNILAVSESERRVYAATSRTYSRIVDEYTLHKEWIHTQSTTLQDPSPPSIERHMLASIPHSHRSVSKARHC